MTHTFKDIFFTQDSLQAVERFYKFYGFEADLLMFKSIVNQKFDFGLTFENGNHFIKTPRDFLIQQLEEELGRCSWAIYDGDDVLEVFPNNFFFEFRRVKLVVIEDEFVRVEGIPHGKRFHILLSKAKKPSLLNFKKFKRVINTLLKEYNLITASSAKRSDKFIGGSDSDWRFKSCAETNRLNQYWQRIGFQSDKKDKYRMYFEKRLN